MCLDLATVLGQVGTLMKHYHLSHDREFVYWEMYEKSHVTENELVDGGPTATGTLPERTEEQKQEAVERTMHYHKLQCMETVALLVYTIPSLMKNIALNLIAVYFLRHL